MQATSPIVDLFDQLMAHPFVVSTGRLSSLAPAALRGALEHGHRLGWPPTHFAESGSLCVVVSPEQMHALLAAGAAPHAEVQMIRLRPEASGSPCSRRCRSCPGWIHSVAGEPEIDRRGMCLCGQAFRITHDLPESQADEPMPGVRVTDRAQVVHRMPGIGSLAWLSG
ncbi:MAG: hypothetical protein EOO75_17430, partial [Myxococcales bacterium]